MASDTDDRVLPISAVTVLASRATLLNASAVALKLFMVLLAKSLTSRRPILPGFFQAPGKQERKVENAHFLGGFDKIADVVASGEI